MWPKDVSPFEVHLIGIRNQESGIREKTEEIYNKLQSAGIEVLYDDREESVGTQFSDADLIGIPIRLVVSEKSLRSSSGQAGEKIEWKERASKDIELLTIEEVLRRFK